MFTDSRTQLLAVGDWIELLQLVLFPAVKDAVNNLLAIQQEKGALSRGSKLSGDSVLIPVVEMLKYVITSRLQEVTSDPGFAALWLNVGVNEMGDPKVLQYRGPDSRNRPAERRPVRIQCADGAESDQNAERSGLLLGKKWRDIVN